MLSCLLVSFAYLSGRPFEMNLRSSFDRRAILIRPPSERDSHEWRVGVLLRERDRLESTALPGRRSKVDTNIRSLARVFSFFFCGTNYCDDIWGRGRKKKKKEKKKERRTPTLECRATSTLPRFTVRIAVTHAVSFLALLSRPLIEPWNLVPSIRIDRTTEKNDRARSFATAKSVTKVRALENQRSRYLLRRFAGKIDFCLCTYLSTLMLSYYTKIRIQ